MNKASDVGSAIVTAIFGLAILAVILSKNSSTTGVLQTAASSLGNILGVVVSPISSGAAANSTSGTQTANSSSYSAPNAVSGLYSAVNNLNGLVGSLPSALGSLQSLGNSLSGLGGF